MRTWLAVLLPALACAPFCAHAEDAQTQDEKEKVEAKAEDDAEAKASESARTPLAISGVLTLIGYDQNKFPDVVIGQMASKGMLYLLKVADADMLKRLGRYDGKQVTLTGKSRNKGKYFIVGSVLEPAPAPIERRKRGGM